MSSSVRFGKDKYHLQGQMEEWCRQHLGNGGWAYKLSDVPDNFWCIQSMFGNTTFTFRNEQDATMFRLVWSGGVSEDE